ncbi:multicopper oxidase family protein [Candidatus Kaiserbacteria bacterium]|nr:multicopper oxidase family protein [Candidatus Kaiserbacteria bacterium]
MKNTLIIGGGILLVLLLAGVFWYDNDYRMGMGRHMDVSGEFAERNGGLTKLTDTAVLSLRPTEVVELKDGDTYELTASIVKQEVGNRVVKRLAYNGQIPGPILKAPKGAKVTVNFTNNLDMETALHSHGLRGDYKMDGAAPLSQDPIPVGGTFTYELEFPDTGIFWYHPHVREDYQQDMGLYGNMVVTELNYWNNVDQEEYLIVDDVLEDGDYSPNVVTNALMGRFGDTLLINDKEDYSLTVQQGAITRLYFTNVANTRTFDLVLPGASVKLVGGDLGRIEQEKMVEDIIIAPAERYVVEVYYKDAGTYAIEHRGKKIGTVVVEPSSQNKLSEFNAPKSHVEDYADIRANETALLGKAPDKRLRLDVSMMGAMGNMMSGGMMGGNDNDQDEMMREHCKIMPEMAGCEPYFEDGEEEHGEDGIEWEDDMAMMNDMSTDHMIEWIIEDQDTKKQNGDIDWSFKQGDLVKVRIYNDEKGAHPMQHPIHFHGQRFVVLARDGKVNDNLQWKDTVLIPKGQTIDLLVDMSNPGEWMAHCHIAEHLHSGMMFDFTVN